MKHVYTYMRPNRGRFYTLEMNCNFDDDPEFVAEECAQDYHDNHNGSDASWPLELLITLTDGRQVLCEVERETRPEFIGTVVSETKPAANNER